MRSLISVRAVTILIAAFGSGMAFAQSSGSFNYGSGQTACVLNNDNTGTISGGQQCASNLVFSATSGTGNCGGVDANGNPNPPCNCIGSVTTGIKTSSGNGNVFVIRPSAVVGLLTNVTVSKNSTSTTVFSASWGGFCGVGSAEERPAEAYCHAEFPPHLRRPFHPAQHQPV